MVRGGGVEIGARGSARNLAKMAKLLAAKDDAPNLSLRIAGLEAKLREMEEEQEQLTEACAVAKEHKNEGKALAKRLTEENAVLLETIAQLEKRVEDGPERADIFKAIMSTSVLTDRTTELAKHVVGLYEKRDLPKLFISVLKRLSKGEDDLLPLLRKAAGFKKVLKVIHAERDASNAKYLGANVHNSGVRVAVFPGSTEYLNQSTNDICDLVMYSVS